MLYLLNMTPDEWFTSVCFWILVACVIISILTWIAEKILDRKERKREKHRRACKRYDVPIRPTRRY